MAETNNSALPLVSIITITFNAGATLERTIVSVERQQCRDFEYIVVDGGSSDDTLDIVRRHGDVVSRCISEPDEGLYYAMNKGLAMAHGDYVWFVNAGDELASPDTFGGIVELLKATDADVAYGHTVITAMDGSVIGSRRLQPPDKLTWRDMRNGMLVCHQAFIARRSICPSYDTHYRFSADYGWCLHILRKAEKIVNSHSVIVRFLDGGMTKQHIAEGLRERFSIMRRNFGLFATFWHHLPIAFRFFFFWLTRGRF